MVVNHARGQGKRHEIVKLGIVLKMVNTAIGYHGKNVLLVVVRASEKELEDVTTQDQRVVVNLVLVNQYRERFAIVQTVLWMETGEAGFHGNHALCPVVLDTRKDLGGATHQGNNLGDQIAEALMLKNEHAR